MFASRYWFESRIDSISGAHLGSSRADAVGLG